MIDLTGVGELLEDGTERVLWSAGTLEPLPAGGAGPAVLVVSEVTDAIKTVEAGRVVGSLDRDDLWSVSAVELDSDVFRRLPAEKMDLGSLIGKVDEAGYRWRVLPVNPGDS